MGTCGFVMRLTANKLPKTDVRTARNYNSKTHNWLHGAESFLTSWQSLSYSINSPPFMEPEGSLPRSQQPATGPYPKPDASTQHLLPYFPKIHYNINLPSTPTSSQWSLPFRFSNWNIVRVFHLPMRATCLAHSIHLDLIILIICDEIYKLWSSSLCNLFQPPATSSPCSHPSSIYALS
jgi:hypothetical protein